MNTDFVGFKVAKPWLRCGKDLIGVWLGIWNNEKHDWKFNEYVMFAAISFVETIPTEGLKIGSIGMGIFRKSGKYGRLIEVVDHDC